MRVFKCSDNIMQTSRAEMDMYHTNINYIVLVAARTELKNWRRDEFRRNRMHKIASRFFLFV